MEYKPHSELVKIIGRGLAWEPSWSQHFGEGARALLELEEQYEGVCRERDEFIASYEHEITGLKEQLEAERGQAWIYRNALQRIAEGSWAVGIPRYTDQPRKFSRDVLRAQASSPASEPKP